MMRWIRATATLLLGVALRQAGGQSTVAVLSLPASARAAGGGDAAGLVTDASALFYNLQQLPLGRSASISAGTWIGDVQVASAAYAAPVRLFSWARSSFAIGVQSLDYGSADEYVPDPLTGGARGTATGGRVSGSETAVSAGLHWERAHYRAGVSTSFVQQALAGLSASTLLLSVSNGIAVARWAVEAGVEHVGTSGSSRLHIPSTLRIGVASPRVRVAGGSWRAVGEYRDSGDLATTSVGALEGTYRSATGWSLDVRGAGLAYSDETARAPWSMGGSAGRGAWTLDYAYQSYGALGAVHRMGVAWRSRDARSPSR